MVYTGSNRRSLNAIVQLYARYSTLLDYMTVLESTFVYFHQQVLLRKVQM